MIQFKLLTIKNFLSFGADPTEIPLDQPGTTLILGEDLDNTANGIGANGVGKTVIINALTYGVYDKAVSNISKDNLVNNINKRHMEVTVEFSKDGNDYRIHRVRKSKNYAAGNYVELYENGQDITPDSVVNTNKLIEQIIGLPYELFVRIVVFSATHVPFLDLPIRSQTGPNQTDIIEELFDLKTLSEKSSVLNEQRKEIETEIKMEMARVSILEDECKRHNIQLVNAKQRVLTWEDTTETEIYRLRAKLDQLKQVNVEEQRKYQDTFTEVTLTVGKAESSQRELTKDLKSETTTLKQSEKELKHLVDEKCPYCLQQFANASKKITKTKKLIKTTSTKVDKLEQKILDNGIVLDDSRKKQKDVKSKITVSKNELDEINTTVSVYELRIIELETTENPHLEPLDELEEVELETINYDNINTLKERVDHMKFLYKLLTKKDSFVRKVLLNKNLPFLNQRLSKYLSTLGLNHQVEFTHEMTASITQFGRELDFGNLSNGQRARVNIALSFAFRDVLQNLHSQVNICMLDEVLDVGLDSPGISAAARMLKRKARDENLSLYIISHRDEIDSAFDRVMIVQMRDGFTQISKES